MFREEYYTEGIKLSLIQKLITFFGGRVKVFSIDVVGKGKLIDFYAFKCDDHGLVISQEYGYGSVLKCPKCRVEEGQETRNQELLVKVS